MITVQGMQFEDYEAAWRYAEARIEELTDKVEHLENDIVCLEIERRFLLENTAELEDALMIRGAVHQGGVQSDD
jgi:hypothetical protein